MSRSTPPTPPAAPPTRASSGTTTTGSSRTSTPRDPAGSRKDRLKTIGQMMGGLDLNKFDSCVDSGTHNADVKNESASQPASATGTPDGRRRRQDPHHQLRLRHRFRRPQQGPRHHPEPVRGTSASAASSATPAASATPARVGHARPRRPAPPDAHRPRHGAGRGNRNYDGARRGAVSAFAGDVGRGPTRARSPRWRRAASAAPGAAFQCSGGRAWMRSNLAAAPVGQPAIGVAERPGLRQPLADVLDERAVERGGRGLRDQGLGAGHEVDRHLDPARRTLRPRPRADRSSGCGRSSAGSARVSRSPPRIVPSDAAWASERCRRSSGTRCGRPADR